MKTEKIAFISTLSMLLLVLLIPACTHKDYPSPIEQTKVRTIASLTKSVADGNTSIFKEKPKVITKEALDDILAKGFQGTSVKNINNYSLKTISEEGMPIIHSVNFNEGGWALVAGREFPDNQIIAYGEIGSFDFDNIESPEVQFWFNMTKSSLKHAFEKADREAESQTETISAREEENRSFSYDDPYVWVRLDLGAHNTNVITNVNHLTETKWSQGDPWNYKCPTLGNNRCPTGCMTVAVAQLLYYLHYHVGTPSGCYHTVDTNYTWNSAGYYTSSVTRGNYTAPSSRWDAMPKIDPLELTTGAQYVGDLMIDVADRLNTEFAASSSADFSSNVFQYYNIICSSPQSYDSSQTIAQLNNSMPVLVSGTRTNGDKHAWLIDGYRKQETLTDHQFVWVTMPPDSLQYYNNINYNYVFTETEMQQFYPEIEENQIIHEYSYSTPVYHYRMNWGWGGGPNYNDIYAIIPDDGWEYKFNVLTITGFTN